jgi:hypothetical protein
LLLAIFTALGGLTCAMYFFNGTDPAWRILSSPPESFYGRPGELGTSNPKVETRQKNIDPRFATSRDDQSKTTSLRRPSSSAVSPISSGAPGALSSGQSGAGNPGAASAPSRGGAVSGTRSTAGGVASKVATTLRSTNQRTVATVRKNVGHSTKNVSKAAKPGSDTTTNRSAQRITQNSQSLPSRAGAAASMRSGIGAGPSGALSGVSRGMGNGLSGAGGGMLGGRH